MSLSITHSLLAYNWFINLLSLFIILKSSTMASEYCRDIFDVIAFSSVLATVMLTLVSVPFYILDEGYLRASSSFQYSLWFLTTLETALLTCLVCLLRTIDPKECLRFISRSIG